jgi:membrane-bound lytic murein transglycosylase B
VLAASSSIATEQSFARWLKAVRHDALVAGISRSTLDTALTNLKPVPYVIKLDQNQPEKHLTLDEYVDKLVTQARIEYGSKKLTEQRALLQGLCERYGVQGRILVALWGIESDFGRHRGNFPVIAATATLSHGGRRPEFFRKELLHALQILDEGHISLRHMRGSWAGAMGQVQFMPSSFREFAVDHEGDGKIDIWNNAADALASAAHYLSHSGWIRGQTWGREVRLPSEFDQQLVGATIRKSVSAWRALGVRPVKGRRFVRGGSMPASLIRPDGRGGRTFLVYDNYRSLLRWNRSPAFAIAVGTLSDKLIGY